jgi:predicted ribosome quality control (RQC) complex YloA/Tae2 family protein
MSLDGILMYKLALELNYLSTGKIDKIQEVSDDEFLLTIRRDRQNYKLLISLTPNYPRINLTENTFSFPREPKSFTMLLRKHFEGSIIDSIKTHETDRIIVIETSRYNELGDFERTELIVEIMGRYSNLVIVNNNYIIDALRHIGVSELRTILPNGKYEFPDTLGKINPFNYSLEELRDELKFIQTPKELTQKILGLSMTCAKLAFESEDFIKNFYSLIRESTPSLNLIDSKKEIGYVNNNSIKTYDSYSKLIDDFFQTQSLKDRIKIKTNNISSFIDKLIKKNENKIIKLYQEIDNAKKAETYKLYGELLMSYSYLNEKKDNIEVLNYYTNENITIPLDKKYYIKENANMYFKKYKKAKTTEVYANKELIEANDEIEYFKLLKSQVDSAEVVEDVLQIQDELIKEHYLIPQHKVSKLQKPKILTFELNGNLIYVGKNNIQNEIVTHELSNKNDLWFHVKDAPGSHVLLKKDDDYSEEEIRACANLAALYSPLASSSSVPVNYTKVKFIKSIPGKKKCFVSISHEKTIYIDPSNEDACKLNRKK